MKINIGYYLRGSSKNYRIYNNLQQNLKCENLYDEVRITYHL